LPPIRASSYVAYDTVIAGTWTDKVQEVVNGRFGVYPGRRPRRSVGRAVQRAGLRGDPLVRFHLLQGDAHRRDWAVALEDNANSAYSVLSRRFPNWGYASSRLHVTPFSWIDEGPKDSEFDDAREPDFVAGQLAAFRAWGAGGSFGNYAYAPPTDFDHEPYADAMRRASTLGHGGPGAAGHSVTSPAGMGTVDASDDQLASRERP
jgi:hypothetical protein